MGESINFYSYSANYKKTLKKDINLLVGCPIQKRDWIIAEWFSHVMAATKQANRIPGFIFVLDPNEEPLNTMIHNLCKINNVDLWTIPIQENDRDDVRDWNHIRFMRMVYLRNCLLEGVRHISPPLFLSLDSDILIHQYCIKSLIEKFSEEYSAIGGKAYMTHMGKHYPSYGMLLDQGNLYRQDSEGVFKVDVIMAIKMMKPEAYNIDYSFDAIGEDIGFSKNCSKSGLRLMWDGTITNKHVMRKIDLGKIDDRCGF